MKRSKIIYGILALSIVIFLSIFIFLFTRAKKYKEFTGRKSVFEGPLDNKISNFIVNAYNGSIIANTPEKFNKAVLDWQEVIPEAQSLIDNYDDILEEYTDILKEYNNIPSFGELDNHQDKLSDHDKKDWKTFVFKYHGEYNEKNCQLCPKTSKLLKDLPIELAMFSIMEEGKELYPHRGPSKHILRLHLGLDIPLGAKITVDGKDYFWKEKEFFLFDDTYLHSVKNTNRVRGVLFIDLDRKHIPSRYIKIANLFGKSYFNNVNKQIEKEATKIK